MTHRLVILDSLFSDSDEEAAVANALGWQLDVWDGGNSMLSGADAVVHVRTNIDSTLLARMPRCRVVGRFGTGLDSVDLDATKDADIAVVNVPDYCVPEMTTHTVVLGLALLRRLPMAMSLPHIDSWSAFREAIPLSGGMRAAIVGLGRIGGSVATALQALGFEVGAVTSKPADLLERMGIHGESMWTAFAKSDIVFLHTALAPSTHHLVCPSLLKEARRGLIVVNTARLGLLDEGAVATALHDGRLGGLGLDALLDAKSPIRAFAESPNVIVTPHIGWYSERSALQLRREAVSSTIRAYGNRKVAAIGRESANE